MLKLDTTTYVMTQDSPSGPVVQLVDDGFDPVQPETEADGTVSKASAAAYILSYALLVIFLATLFFAFKA